MPIRAGLAPVPPKNVIVQNLTPYFSARDGVNAANLPRPLQGNPPVGINWVSNYICKVVIRERKGPIFTHSMPALQRLQVFCCLQRFRRVQGGPGCDV